MAKLDPRQIIQKRRTEDEMREAFTVLLDSGGNMACKINDIDSPDIVMEDVIKELLEARALITEMRNFAQIWLAKATIKR